MQKLILSLCTLSMLAAISCQDSPAKQGAETVNSDTVYTGLEGTRDQAAQMSTGVKQDTSSRQSTTGNSSGKDSIVANSDDQFLKDQVAGNQDEIEVAKLAKNKSTDKEIKSIAQYLVEEHSKALDKLRKMASAKNLTVVSAASDEAKSTISSLESKKANEFDKAWCEKLIDKHKSTISKYESAATSVSNNDLKSFINETLPKLRMHLDKLMAYHGKIKT